ncbi:MAG: M56 family metallopeptidase [Saprospiraceae bacterium]
MMEYLLHASILLIGCYVFYWILLRKETFFKLNRFFLLGVLIISLGLPLISIPPSLSLRQNFAKEETTRFTETEEIASYDLSSSKEVSTAIDVPAANSTTTAPMRISFWQRWDIAKILWMVYLAGVIVFVLTFLIQLVILFVKKKNLAYIQDGSYRIYELTNDNPPYSFLHWIFINPSLYDFDTYQQIIDHEKIHVSQSHFIDKMVAEFVLIVFWFNPFVWLYRKAIANNLEYLTDKEMLQKGTEKEAYQFSLLKVSVPEYALNLTTNYNQSFLQKRIKMMNAKKSSAQSSWKYLLLLPLLAFSVASMNAVNLETPTTINLTNKVQASTVLLAPSLQDTVPSQTEKEIEREAKRKMEREIERESQKEMRKVEKEKMKEMRKMEKEKMKEMRKMEKEKMKEKRKEKEKSKKRSSHSSNGNAKIKSGHWAAKIELEEVCFNFANQDKEGSGVWQVSDCFQKSEFDRLPIGETGTFNLTRGAGTLVLQGGFAKMNAMGEGTFSFKINADFVNYLQKEGLGKPNDQQGLSLFFGNIDQKFVQRLKQDRYTFNLKELVRMSHHGIDYAQIEGSNRIFDMLKKERNLKDLVKLAIHNVTEKYAIQIGKLAPTELSFKKLVAAKIHNVTPEYASALASYGFPNLSLKELTSMAIHNVSIDDIEIYKAMGYGNLTSKEVTSFAIHGVNGADVKAYKALGYGELTAKELTSFAIHNVSPSYIEKMKNSGFGQLEASDLISGKIHGVTGDYRKELEALGVTGLEFKNLKAGKIHGVSKSFVERARAKGHAPKTLKAYIKLKIHGI